MSSNVMAILDDARTRLATTQQRAQDVEMFARRILDMLARETQAWRESVEAEQRHADEARERLSRRWGDLESRINALAERAKGEWSGLGQAIGEHWEDMRHAWTECAAGLAKVEEMVAEHQQGCRTSESDHRQLAESHREAMREGAERVEETATKGNRVQGAMLIDRARETQAAVEDSVARHASTSRSTSEAAQTRQQAITRFVDGKRAQFDARATQDHGIFETGVTDRIEGLREAASTAKSGMVDAAEVISDLTSTLVKGADDVVDTLNVTNVGLRTAVGIVQASVEICDEVIDAWNN